MSEKPGPDVAVMALAPPQDAPITAASAAISSSIWMNTPRSGGSSRAIHSMISVAGVIGYPAKKRHPACIAPSAHASLPWISLT